MTAPSQQALTDDLRAVAGQVLAKLGVPGAGATAQRHEALATLARTRPVDLARLAEAHADALAILSEAGCDPVGGCLYGVWAATSPGDALAMDHDQHTVSGTKPFCSGLGIVDRALVTATGVDDRQVLLDLRVADDPTVKAELDQWATPALRQTNTGRMRFDRHPFEPDRVVGKPGFYLSRPGFWHGAIGPASCWAGGAIGLIDAAENLTGSDPHRLAHLGAMRSAAWTMQAALRQAGDQIDADPADGIAAEYRARSTRHMIERLCTQVLDHFSQSLGPRPFVSDPSVASRYADVHLYLRQHHAERDLQPLGALPRSVPNV